MSDLTVTPRALVVAPGTSVTWVNTGLNQHTVTEDQGLFESGVMVPGDDFRLSAPATPGTYAYHCRFHSYIRGTLSVSLVSLDTPAPVAFGGRPMLAGTVPDVGAGTVVHVERRLPGAWEDVGAVVTDGAGAFRLTGPPITARTAFRAMAGESMSPSIRADAHPTVTLIRRRARVVVRVQPAPRGAPAHLERLDLDTYRWETVASRRLSAGQTRFHLKAPGVYRAMVEARDGLSAAESRVVAFRPGAFRQ